MEPEPGKSDWSLPGAFYLGVVIKELTGTENKKCKLPNNKLKVS